MEVLFTLPGDHGPVSVVGDFNGWDPYAHPMRLGDDGRYSVTIAIPQGEAFAFRYLADGGRWFDDDHADEYDHRGAIFRVAVPAMPKAAAARNGAARNGAARNGAARNGAARSTSAKNGASRTAVSKAAASKSAVAKAAMPKAAMPKAAEAKAAAPRTPKRPAARADVKA
ncbi:isoamylase early set domain-containing protein [Nonomuraea typhae]|uniref:Isoamylase early set domain-containing protein n=1 Tax=Nonomuraea typhae TaxID=2603600 RepID=A0ABW7Z9M5_9ACTN